MASGLWAVAAEAGWMLSRALPECEPFGRGADDAIAEMTGLSVDEVARLREEDDSSPRS